MADEKTIVIWDWDGALVDSLTYKYLHVWEDVFPGETEKHKFLIDLINTPEGKKMNRYELMREALVHFGDKTLEGISREELADHPLMQEYGKRYAGGSVPGIVKTGLFPDSKRVLQELSDDDYPMYIISTSKHEDLQTITEALQVDHYFKLRLGFGWPPFIERKSEGEAGGYDKYESFKEVAAREGTEDPARYVVIGDGSSDHKLAQQIGCRFIALATRWNGWAEDKEMQPFLAASLSDVPRMIKEGI